MRSPNDVNDRKSAVLTCDSCTSSKSSQQSQQPSPFNITVVVVNFFLYLSRRNFSFFSFAFKDRHQQQWLGPTNLTKHIGYGREKVLNVEQKTHHNFCIIFFFYVRESHLSARYIFHVFIFVEKCNTRATSVATTPVTASGIRRSVDNKAWAQVHDVIWLNDFCSGGNGCCSSDSTLAHLFPWEITWMLMKDQWQWCRCTVAEANG